MNIIDIEKVKELTEKLSTISKEGKRTIILVGGVTASGKTTVAEYLVATFPDYFHKMKQVTTRKRRIGESNESYDFMSMERYDRLINDNKLFATTKVGENSYGTYKVVPEGKIGLVVVNNEGMLDSMEMEEEYNIIRIGIYCDPSVIKNRLSDQYDINDPSSVERFNRDVDSEFVVYQNCHHIVDNNGPFLDTISGFVDVLL